MTMSTIKRFLPIILVLVVLYFVWTKFVGPRMAG